MTVSGNPRRRSRADVADMALRLLDEHGLPDLTMRNLAEALGVQPSALYWHFPNKQALLAAVSERILAPVRETDVDGMAAREVLRALGAKLRERLLAYRDGAELVSSSLALGLVTSPIAVPPAPAPTAAAGSDDLARIAAEAVTHFVVGYVFHEQQRRQADSLGLLAARDTLTPEAASAPNAEPGGPGSDFAAALTMIADGFVASLPSAERSQA